MRLIRIFVVLGFLLTLGYSAPARADFLPAAWQFKKDITLPANMPRQTLVRIQFDEDVFSRAQEDLRDIRIVNTQYEEVPYVFLTEAPHSASERLAARIFNKGIKPGVSTSFTVDTGNAGKSHNQISLVIGNTNFRREVQIEGSNDQRDWVALATNHSIYDYTLEFKARDTTVPYNETDYRYLRVTIFDRGETPLTIRRTDVYQKVYNEGKQLMYPSTIVEQAEDRERQNSRFIFDLGVKGLPTNNVAFITEAANFHRQILLEGSNDRESWQTVAASAVLFSYTTPNFTGSKLAVTYPEANWRYIRLTIFNRDNKPLIIQQADFTGFVKRLVFESAPNTEYALYYGNSETRFPDYDLKNYLSYYKASNFRDAALGEQITSSRYEPPVQPLSERYPSLLTGALIAAVAVIGLLIFRLLQRTK